MNYCSSFVIHFIFVNLFGSLTGNIMAVLCDTLQGPCSSNFETAQNSTEYLITGRLVK